MLRKKYLKGKSFFEYKLGKGTSFVWQGICKSKDVLFESSCFKLRDGKDISLWSDPQVCELPDFIPIVKVSELKKGANEWNKDLVQNICDCELALAILKIQWPPVLCNDKLIWILISLEGQVKDCVLAMIDKHFLKLQTRFRLISRGLSCMKG